MSELNWWAIVVAAVAMHLLGWAWYGPLFGKTWMAISGHKMDGGSKSDGMKAMAWGLIFSLLMNAVLAYVLSSIEGVTVWCGVGIGALLWLGFVATTMMNRVLYEKMQMKLFWLNSLYYLVSLGIAGAIIAAWH